MCSKLHVDKNASLNQYSFCIHLQRSPCARALALPTFTTHTREPRCTPVDRKMAASDDANSKWPAWTGLNRSIAAKQDRCALV